MTEVPIELAARLAGLPETAPRNCIDKRLRETYGISLNAFTRLVYNLLPYVPTTRSTATGGRFHLLGCEDTNGSWQVLARRPA